MDPAPPPLRHGTWPTRMKGPARAHLSNLSRLLATLLAFFFAVARPPTPSTSCTVVPSGPAFRARCSSRSPWSALAAAVPLGIAGVARVGWALFPVRVRAPSRHRVQPGTFRRAGPFRSRLRLAGFLSGLVAYVAQTGRLAISPGGRGGGSLCPVGGPARAEPAATADPTPDRARWRASITLANGDVVPLDHRTLLAPLERALHAMSWAVVLLAASLAVVPARPSWQTRTACGNPRR